MITSAPRTGERSARIPELDGLRGLAILLVVAGHTLNYTLQFGQHAGHEMGEVGVLLFFVLSGYLITGLLNAETRTAGVIHVQSFYVRRAYRLLPALTAYLAGIAALRWLGIVSNTPAKDFVATVLYVRNIFGESESFGHLWSLSLEEQFYILWPLAFLACGAKRMRSVAIWICISVAIWRGVAIWLNLWPYYSGVYYMRPWFRFDAIAIGCWMALVPLPNCPKWTTGISATLLVGWSLYGERISQPLFITGQTIFASALVFSVIKSRDLTRRVFSQGWLRWLGSISYSLYLWQQIFTVSMPNLGWIRQFPVDIVAALAVAVVSRKFVEEPFLRLRNRRLQRESAFDSGSAVLPLLEWR